MKFLQGQVWKTLQKDIFKKDVFFIDEKIWIQKTKNFLNWQQMIGLTSQDLENIFFAKNKIKNQKKLNTIFFQVGLIDEISRINVKGLNEATEKNINQKRVSIEQDMQKKWLKISFRENMPLASCIVKCDQNDEDLWSWYNSQTKSNIKKARNSGYEFSIGDEKAWDEFYQIWESIGWKKGFNIWDKESYERLKKYCLESKNWHLFVASWEGKIAAWSIVMIQDDMMYYLYGAWNREFWNRGAHHFLMDQIIKWGRENKIDHLDFFWTSPSWRAHHLDGVSRFKLGFGGEKIDYYWNYDIVFNPIFYKIFSKKNAH